MGYVALSRVRRLDALSLAGINQMALRVSPKRSKSIQRFARVPKKMLSAFEPLRKKARNERKSKKKKQKIQRQN